MGLREDEPRADRGRHRQRGPSLPRAGRRTKRPGLPVTSMATNGVGRRYTKYATERKPQALGNLNLSGRTTSPKLQRAGAPPGRQNGGEDSRRARPVWAWRTPAGPRRKRSPLTRLQAARGRGRGQQWASKSLQLQRAGAPPWQNDGENGRQGPARLGAANASPPPSAGARRLLQRSKRMTRPEDTRPQGGAATADSAGRSMTPRGPTKGRGG